MISLFIIIAIVFVLIFSIILGNAMVKYETKKIVKENINLINKVKELQDERDNKKV